MIQSPSIVAVELLQTTHDYLQKNLDVGQYSTASLSEAIRILTLNQTIQSWLQQDSKADYSFFSEISLTGKKNSVTKKELSEIMDFYSFDQTGFLFSKISSINVLQLADLLGFIHNIGAHIRAPRGYSQKRIYGAFYTSSAIASFIAQRVMSDYLFRPRDGKEICEVLETMKVLDPCCGPGIFLLAAYSVSKSHLVNTDESSQAIVEALLQFTENLYGVDLDPAALELASCMLSILSGDSSFSKHKNQFRVGNALMNNVRLIDRTVINQDEVSSSMKYFEWTREFPKILDEGGFDIILYNPPYLRLRPNLAEFMRARLRTDSQVDLKEYEGYKQRLKDDSKYYRSSGEYTSSISGSINTYQLFIERSLALAREGGQIGFIVPSTLLADYSSRKLRREMFSRNTIHSFFEFPETARLFNGVTQSLCIGHIERGGVTKEFRAKFGTESLEHAENNEQLSIKVQDIQKSFPTSLSIPKISKNEWSFLRKLHRNPPVSAFSWLRNHRGELDLTIDREYIIEGEGSFPLIRGSSIGRYRTKKSSKHVQEHVDIDEFRQQKRNSKRIEDIEKIRLACQQISNQAHQWRLKFSLIPRDSVVSNSCNYLVIRSEMPKFILNYLLGVMNSDLMNWRFSISSSNNHVSNHEISELPLIDPTSSKYEKLARKIAVEVQKIKTESLVRIPKLESMVFSLYGFKKNEVRRILESRRITESEMKEILTLL